MASAAKILVVDDEAILVSLIRDCLEAQGFNVSTACCGAEGEKRLQENEFDLLLTDIRMPDIDGVELSRRARSIQPGIDVLFMTGYADLDSAKNAISEGALDYLMKPFEVTEIRSAINRALKKRSDRQSHSQGAELNRLSKLSALMGSVNEIDSLFNVSLDFALLQSGLKKGAIIYWSEFTGKIVCVSTSSGDTKDAQFNSLELDKSPFENSFLQDNPEVEDFTVFSTMDQHPLMSDLYDREISSLSYPEWMTDRDCLVSVPICRNEKLFGYILIGVEKESIHEIKNDLKFIVLTSQQTAMSIENLTLLRKTQDAYKRLQSLQKKTIGLETMAVRGEMASEIGHEIKNFLGVVSGNLSLLEHHAKSGEINKLSRHVKVISDDLNKMKKFTESLMKESTWSSEKVVADVGLIVQDTIDFLKPQSRFKNVRVELDIAANPPSFLTDPVQFQQLLCNLANNAADATRGKKDRNVKISLTSADEDNRFSLIVEDNGSGIEPELIDKLFSSKFTTKDDGNGYGLIVCNRIIESHDGLIEVESTPGKGSKFSISFTAHRR
ncbi:MAG: response regulator [candidate division Zixibacteria bacterium]|nr:response regulator [candidate division Zixibacteria bacterium]